MSGLSTSQMMERLQQILPALDAALTRGINQAVDGVNTIARRNLSGAKDAAPWTYPVPRRSGNLLRSQKGQRATAGSPFAGFVFNNAPYAAAIHNGYVSEWAGRGKHRMRMKGGPRPFLDDAVTEFDPLMVMQREVLDTWSAQWA